MAEPLKTELGFEAAGAISTLNSLSGALDNYTTAMRKAASATRAFNKAARKVDSVITGFASAQQKAAGTQKEIATASDKVSKALKKQEKSIDSVKKSTDKTAKSTKKAAGQMILSWKSVIRIFTIQVIHQAVSKLTSALGGSVSAAIDLEVQFAEIQTISKQLRGNFEGVSQGVRELSDEFGIAANVVAEGTYQTLSNQVAQGAEAFEFFSAAADFSVAAVTSADASVNLLSSTINAFGYNASQTSEIAGKLFKTIELGRIRGEEFANTFGRVAVLASNLGVSLDEVLASIATLTISGLKYNEAFTLINNVMLKLIRPTEAMKNELAALGLVSAEAGIQAFGFQGLLTKLRDRAGDTASELGELFGRVRAIRGALGLTGAAAETYVKNLEAIQQATSETLLEAKKIIFETNAKQVQIEIEKLKNAIVFDFGRNALAAIKWVSDAFGGFINIMKAATASLVALAIAIAAVNVKFLVGIGLISPMAAAIAAVTVAAGALIIAYNKLTESAIGGIEERRAAEEEAIEQEKRDIASLTEIRIRSLRKQFSETQKYIIDRLSSSQELIQNAVVTEGFISNHLDQQLDLRKAAFDNFVRSIESSMKKATSNINQSQKNIFSLQMELSREIFEGRQAGRTEIQQAFALIQRGAKLSREASKEFRSGHRDRATSLFSESKQLFNQAKQIGENTSNYRLQNRAQSKAEGTLKNQVKLNQQFAQSEAKRRKSLGEQLPDEKARQTRINAVIERLKEWQTLTDKGIFQYDTAEAAKADIKPALDFLQKEFDAAGLQINIFKRLDEAGTTDIQDALSEVSGLVEDAFTGKKITLEFAYEQRIREVFKHIKDISKDFPIELVTELKELGFGTTLKGLQDFSAAMITIQKDTEKVIRATSALKIEEKDLADLRKTNLSILGESNRLFREQTVKRSLGRGMGDPGTVRFGKEQYKSIEDANVAQQKAVKLWDQVIAGAARARENIEGTFDPVKFQNALTSMEGAKRALDAMGQTTAAENALKLMEGYTKEATKIQGIDLLKVQAEGASAIETSFNRIVPLLTTEIPAAATETSNAMESIGAGAQAGAAASQAAFSATIVGLKQIETQAHKTAAAMAAAGGGAKSAALGGMIYRQMGGGTSRGTDTIPAMLSPGEFVVNARNSRKFYSQLVAMNSGVKPIFRQEGGPVTNVGDVSINVQGAPTPTQTARETMAAFRREMRRRGSNLS